MLTLHWSNLLNLLPDSIIAIVLIVMAVPFLIYGMAVAARNYLSAMKSMGATFNIRRMSQEEREQIKTPVFHLLT